MTDQPRSAGSPRRLTALSGKILLLAGLLALSANAATCLTLTAGPQAGSQEIQAALDSLSKGGEVVLGPGSYLIHQPLLLQRDYAVLRGSGSNTVLRLADNANCPVVVLGAAFAPAPKVISHLRLADLVIDGNRKHQTVELWRTAADGSQINNNGVDIRGATDATVERVVCGHCRSGGLVASAGIRRLTVHDFTAFDNEFDGLACYLTEDSRFTGLSLHDNLAAGISLDLSFNHNVIENAVLAANDLGVFMRDSRNNVFEGLTIRDSHRHGVFVAQAAAPTAQGWQLVSGTECTGNRFTRVQMTHCGVQPFLIHDTSCTGNVVSGLQLLDEAPLAVTGDLAGANGALAPGQVLHRQASAATPLAVPAIATGKDKLQLIGTAQRIQ